MSQPTGDHGPEYRHVDHMPWETLRFPGQHSKMQYTGPEAGKGPIYDGRFNMKERKPLSEENLKV